MHSHLQENGVLSRERALALAVIVATGILLYLCYRLIEPFLACLAWALALAVVAQPIHRRVSRGIAPPNPAAALSVVIVALIIVFPTLFVTQNLVSEAGRATALVEQELNSVRLRQALEERPRLRRVLTWLAPGWGLSDTAPPARSGDGGAPTARSASPSRSQDPAAPLARAADALSQSLGSLVRGTVWLCAQLLITLMTLFFFLRDQRAILRFLRTLLPFSHSEEDRMFERISETIHATLYGSLVVAGVQGAMGGLMFWLLGLPAPLMWGAVMALLAVVPVLGTFVIWAPTAAFLAMRGDWTKAIILVGWGAIAIGLIDNLLYPFLVGQRMRFHTLLVFFAILGGLFVFGASGLILGPLVLAGADAVLHIWRERTAHGGTLEDGGEAAAA